jgi:hypothetical protein
MQRNVDRDVLLLLVLAAAKLAFHVATDNHYGFHRDELALLDDARRLAWGYVAYPPLTPFFGRLSLMLFGTSLAGFRFFAALAQSVAFVVTGLTARALGAGRGGMVIAAVAAAIAPISLAASSLMQYVSFDYLWFVLMAYFVVRLARDGDPRWCLGIGATIGLGVLTKYAVAFYVAGLAAGVLFTPLRVYLRSKWLWFGALLALLLALPNLIWQVQHGFISLEFLKFIHARDVRIGRTDGFLAEQFYIASNVVTVPLWLFGLYAVFRDRRDRAIGWMYVVTMALFIAAKARGYYSGPLYPMLIAAGAASLPLGAASGWRRAASGKTGAGSDPMSPASPLSPASSFSRPRLERIIYATAAVLLTAFGVLTARIALPITAINSRAFRMNGDFVEEIGWPELTREVARIWNTIPPEERAHAAIFCGNYGEAGAVDLYGPAYGLPPVISGINSYWQRGPGNPVPTTLLIVGSSRETLEKRFTFVQLAGHVSNPYGVHNEETERHPDIFLCRGLRAPLDQVWPRIRSFG